MYTGQALGNYNGGILQTLDAVTWKPIRTKGGWVEGFVYLTPNLHSHTGIGIDDPNDDDITAIPISRFGRTYNSTLWSNLIWDLNKSFRIAFEVTYRETDYKEPTNLPNKGWGFHTQFSGPSIDGYLVFREGFRDEGLHFAESGNPQVPPGDHRRSSRPRRRTDQSLTGRRVEESFLGREFDKVH